MKTAQLIGPLALLGLAAGLDAVSAKPREVPVATPDGKAQSCIPIIGMESRVRDDRTIDFFVGRLAYRNVLPHSCPELSFEEAFGYQTSLSQLCSTDIITVLHRGTLGIPGASCGLGQFQPVTGLKR